MAPKDLGKLNGPVIVFIEPRGYKNFAVMRGFRGDRVHLADPSRGNIRMPAYRFQDSWWVAIRDQALSLYHDLFMRRAAGDREVIASEQLAPTLPLRRAGQERANSSRDTNSGIRTLRTQIAPSGPQAASKVMGKPGSTACMPCTGRASEGIGAVGLITS